MIAQVVLGYSLIQIVIAVVVVAAVIGIALVAIRAAGIAIPPWVMQIFWIVVVAIIAILAIRIVASLL